MPIGISLDHGGQKHAWAYNPLYLLNVVPYRFQVYLGPGEAYI